jgi:hypothetical protein
MILKKFGRVAIFFQAIFNSPFCFYISIAPGRLEAGGVYLLELIAGLRFPNKIAAAKTHGDSSQILKASRNFHPARL